MDNLLQSKPDGISSLSGKDLVRKKVKKLVCMAARFDHEMGKFREYNVVTDSTASKIVFDNWPTTIIFSGFEIGMRIHTGLPLINSDIKNSPVKEVFQISIPMNPQDKNGRMSWDQTAVLVAIRGYERYYTGVPGKIICNTNGSNGWKHDVRGHIYIAEKTPSKEVQELINKLMMHQPSGK
jgi:inosine-uridine nucleoside N-ribohydrolase